MHDQRKAALAAQQRAAFTAADRDRPALGSRFETMRIPVKKMEARMFNENDPPEDIQFAEIPPIRSLEELIEMVEEFKKEKKDDK